MISVSVQSKEFVMNQFFYETRGKEKIQEIIKEGLVNQELHRSGAIRYGFFNGLLKLTIIVVFVLGTLSLIAR
jgi:hypothetical protein